jgi:hypothetical protein
MRKKLRLDGWDLFLGQGEGASSLADGKARDGGALYAKHR